MIDFTRRCRAALIALGVVLVVATLVSNTVRAHQNPPTPGETSHDHDAAEGPTAAVRAAAEGIERRVLENTIARRFLADYNRAAAAGDMTVGQGNLFVLSMPAQVRRFVELDRGASWLVNAVPPSATPAA